MAPNQFGGPTAPPDGGGGPPQAGPPQGVPNMLAQPQGAPPGAPGAPDQQQPPVAPPSPEMMKEALTKQSMMAATLKQLLGKPDLSTKDILDSTGELVAEQVLSPFAAAKSLADLPPDGDSLQLRQWVGQHYANATRDLQVVSSMLAAHGQMMRQQQAGAPALGVPAPPPQGAPAGPPPAMSNQFSGAQ